MTPKLIKIAKGGSLEICAGYFRDRATGCVLPFSSVGTKEFCDLKFCLTGKELVKLVKTLYSIPRYARKAEMLENFYTSSGRPESNAREVDFGDGGLISLVSEFELLGEETEFFNAPAANNHLGLGGIINPCESAQVNPYRFWKSMLTHFERVEDYERCAVIRDKIKELEENA